MLEHSVLEYFNEILTSHLGLYLAIPVLIVAGAAIISAVSGRRISSCFSLSQYQAGAQGGPPSLRLLACEDTRRANGGLQLGGLSDATVHRRVGVDTLRRWTRIRDRGAGRVPPVSQQESRDTSDGAGT